MPASTARPGRRVVELVVTDADWDAATPSCSPSMFGQLVLIRTFEELVLELAGAGLIHGPAHSSIGQEGGAVGSVLALTQPTTPSTARTAATTSSWPRCCTTSHPKGIDLPEPSTRTSATVLLRTLARDLRPGPRLLPRPRRLDAPAVEGGRRDRHQRDRRRRRAAGRRLGVGPPARRHRRRRGHLLRRRRGQHRLDARDVQPGRRLEAAAVLLHREQPVRRLHPRRRGRPREPRLSARGPGFGIPSWRVDGMDPLAVYLAMQEALDAHALRHGPDRHRGRRLPLLPPERPLPRQRLRLPHQGRGGRSGADRDPIDLSPRTWSAAGCSTAGRHRRRPPSGPRR